MSHPFGNDEFRFGSAAFVGADELKAEGMFRQTPTSVFVGFFDGKPLWYDDDGGLLLVGGARSGKLRDILAYNICNGTLAKATLCLLDMKGELAALSQDQTQDQKFCLYWNPLGLHGLQQHRVNPVDYLQTDSRTLVSDTKVFIESIVPLSGAAQSEYFELRAREWLEAIALTRTRIDGCLTLPALYATINLIPGNGPEWLDFAYEMYSSDIPLCRRVEEEVAAAREDGSGGFRGIMGEMFKALSCLSDPVLRNSVSSPYDFSLSDLCSLEQFYQVYLMCPPELLQVWAPVVKTLFTSAMIYKSRAPQAPKQTWILDECAQLKGFELVTRMFTYGAGIGIRPWAVFQSAEQMNDLSRKARDTITSSAGLQIYFSLRDLTSARTVSDMLGSETLCYDDPLQQGRAEVDYRKALRAILNGANPFAALFEIDQKRYETVHLSKQRRPLRTPDEVLNAPGNRHFLFADGLSGPVYAERAPYWTQRFMAGRYHPNPYHPPLDKVRVQGRFGPRWRPVITEPVPEAYAHYPQYRDGVWSYIRR